MGNSCRSPSKLSCCEGAVLIVYLAIANKQYLFRSYVHVERRHDADSPADWFASAYACPRFHKVQSGTTYRGTEGQSQDMVSLQRCRTTVRRLADRRCTTIVDFQAGFLLVTGSSLRGYMIGLLRRQMPRKNNFDFRMI